MKYKTTRKAIVNGSVNVNILKNNNFYCGYYELFGRRWYDIQFINLENPVVIDKFGFNMEV